MRARERPFENPYGNLLLQKLPKIDAHMGRTAIESVPQVDILRHQVKLPVPGIGSILLRFHLTESLAERLP